MNKRNGNFGIATIEIGVILAVIAVLTVIVLPSFLKEHHRAQANVIRNNARVLNAAVDQWVLQKDVKVGTPIDLKAIAAFVRPDLSKQSVFQQSLQEGKVPLDILGHAFVLGKTGPKQVQVAEETKKALAGVMQDWGSY